MNSLHISDRSELVVVVWVDVVDVVGLFVVVVSPGFGLSPQST